MKRACVITLFSALFIMPILTVMPYRMNGGYLDPVVYASDEGEGGGGGLSPLAGSEPTTQDFYQGAALDAVTGVSNPADVSTDKVSGAPAARPDAQGDGTENLDYQDQLQQVFTNFETEDTKAVPQSDEEFQKETTQAIIANVQHNPNLPIRETGFNRGKVLDLEAGK